MVSFKVRWILDGQERTSAVFPVELLCSGMWGDVGGQLGFVREFGGAVTKRGLSARLRRTDGSATAYAPLPEAPLTLPRASCWSAVWCSSAKNAGVMPG